MPATRELLLSILLPAVLCGLLLASVWGGQTSKAHAQDRRYAIAGGFAFALGYLCAHWALLGAPAWPKPERTLAARDWIPWVVLCVPLVGLTGLARISGGILRACGASLLLCAIVVLSMKTPLAEPYGWIAGFIVLAILALVALSTTELAGRVRGAGVPLALFVVVTSASVAALFARTASIAQLLSGLAACLGASVVIAWWNKRFSLAGGAVHVTLIVLAAALINAVWFGELSKSSALLLVLALLTPRLADASMFRRWAPWKRVVLRAVCAALPAAAGVFIAHDASAASDDGY